MKRKNISQIDQKFRRTLAKDLNKRKNAVHGLVSERKFDSVVKPPKVGKQAKMKSVSGQ